MSPEKPLDGLRLVKGHSRAARALDLVVGSVMCLLALSLAAAAASLVLTLLTLAWWWAL